MTFKDIRFPDRYHLFGVQGGAGWETQVNEVDSGFEYRIALLAQPRGRWEISHEAMTRRDFEELQAFWMIVRGRAYGFRFKDWLDYQVTASTSAFVVIDSTHAQLAKRYTFGSETFDRKLRKIVASSFSATGGSGLSLDATTGILTHSGLPSSFACEFDVPVRFDMDESPQQIAQKKQGAGNFIVNWPGIQLREIRT